MANKLNEDIEIEKVFNKLKETLSVKTEMPRPAEDISSTIVVGVRLQPKVIEQLKKIAIKESLDKHENITYNDLIRNAINKFYGVNFNVNNNTKIEIENYKLAFEDIEIKDLFKKEEIISFIESDNGRIAFVQRFAEVVTDYVHSYSIARKLISVDKLPPEALSRYDLGTNGYMWSNNKIEKLDSPEVIIPVHESMTYPSIRLAEIKQKNSHQTLSEMAKKAAIDLLYKEEKMLFNLLTGLSNQRNKYLLDDIDLYLKNHDIVLIPNKSEYIEFFNNYFKSSNKRPPFVLNIKNSRNYNFKKSKFVIVEESLLNDVVIINTEDVAENGVLVERQGITVLPADDPMVLRLGWVIFEEIGMAITGENVKFLTL